MDTLDTIICNAEQVCKANGTRLTAKRKQVLSGLIQSDKALSAYELIDFCKKAYGKTIPAMTVYRILEFLEDEHLAHKLYLTKKYVVCTQFSAGHTHEAPQFLICRDCNRVKEININKPTVSELQKSVKKAGFQLVKPQLELNCICNDCAKASA